MSKTDKLQVLQSVFGYDSFRQGQAYLIDSLASGRDALGILPTGGGKSLCYQIPALIAEGVTIVVSPLVSLMKDQVMNLKARGVPAAYLNSLLTPYQLQLATQRALAGQYKIIYVAPERLKSPSFAQLAQHQKIPLVAIDEAHCISQWGQEFRPDYLNVGDYINSLPKRPTIGAFTATATEPVKKDIIRLLQLNNPTMITTGFDRPNLYFGVITAEKAEKDLRLREILQRHENESVIIYCSSRKAVDSLAESLNRDGFAAAGYHAGMSDDERKYVQDGFSDNRFRIMVATCAFGMGIDKPDVRCVVHYSLPRSLEAYYQQAGRAGRDGKPGECILLYNENDAQIARYLLTNSEPSDRLMPQQQTMVRKQDHHRLDCMIEYAQAGRCLRRSFIHYFGQKAAPSCDNCSVCLSAKYTVKPNGLRSSRFIPAKQKVDLSKIRVGSPVCHRTFGKGRIVAIENKIMKVAFAHDTKSFEYPEALERAYLALDTLEEKR